LSDQTASYRLAGVPRKVSFAEGVGESVAERAIGGRKPVSRFGRDFGLSSENPAAESPPANQSGSLRNPTGATQPNATAPAGLRPSKATTPQRPHGQGRPEGHKANGFRPLGHSHSIVAGGLEEMS
jgi:hypothetical protein